MVVELRVRTQNVKLDIKGENSDISEEPKS
jgi:hypothetical protein